MFAVRPGSRKDLPEVFLLAKEYASFDATPTLADVEGFYARNPEYFFIAEDDSGKILGFVTGYERKGVPENVLRTWGATRVGYIELMAVGQYHRRRGIGTTLLNRLIEQFRKTGIDLVLLDVPADQEEAVRLYRKAGFEVRAHNMKKHLG